MFRRDQISFYNISPLQSFGTYTFFFFKLFDFLVFLILSQVVNVHFMVNIHIRSRRLSLDTWFPARTIPNFPTGAATTTATTVCTNNATIFSTSTRTYASTSSTAFTTTATIVSSKDPATTASGVNANSVTKVCKVSLVNNALLQPIKQWLGPIHCNLT